MGEPYIQELDTIVDVYFCVGIESDDSRIKEHDLNVEALSVWVTFIEYNKENYLIDLADEGVGVGGEGLVFTDEEKNKIMEHIKKKMNEVNWK